MNIENAERALTVFVAARCGTSVHVYRGELPPGMTGAAVRFTSGSCPGEDLAEFSAEVSAVFDTPTQAQGFADAVWQDLPVCNTSGFARIAAAGGIDFAASGGKFTVRGRLAVAFC